jgi:S1-C subfamily serine protease
MADPRPLTKTTLGDVQLLTLDGRPVHARHQGLSQTLRSRATGRAAALFAEPLAGAAAITWYTEGGGDPQNLSDLPGSRADGARQALTRTLAEIEPLLDDPGIGAALRHALVVPGRRSIWVTDQGVVLSDWGSVAAGGATTGSALAAQVRDVFGAYSPALGRVDERFFAGAPMSVFSDAATSAHLAAAPPRAAAMAAVPRPVPVAAAPAPAARPLWVLPLVTLVALLFLVLGFWLAWTSFARDLASQRVVVPLIDEAATNRAIEAQRETNAALERELERARQALLAPNVCTPAGPLELNPAPSRQPVPPAAVPPAVPAPSGQAPQAPASNLAELLERSTVMVVAIGPGGGTLGHGTGFFVNGTTVVTNAHVVEGGVGGQLFITSATLGRAIPAQLIGMSRGPDGGNVQPGQLDVAALRLPEAVPGAQPLALTTQGGRLTDVVAAGYPASVVAQETEMRGFIQELGRGSLSRPPELVVTRGVVSSVQQVGANLTILPHSADISAGNSGGPLVDNCGRVVGVNTFVTRASAFADRVKYAQKTDSLLAWLQQNNVLVETRADACTPILPGLPAAPAPGATPGATPPAATPPATTPTPGAPAAPPAR